MVQPPRRGHPHGSSAEQQSALLGSARPRAMRWRTGSPCLPEVEAGTANFAALCRDNNIAALEIARPRIAPAQPCVRCNPEHRLVHRHRSAAPGDADPRRAFRRGHAENAKRNRSLHDGIQPARRAEEKYPHAVSAVHPGHRAVHFVRRHLDRAAALAPDHLAHLGAAGGRQRGPQRESRAIASAPRPSTNWPRWCAPSTK